MNKLKSLVSNTRVMFTALLSAIAEYYRRNRDTLGRFTNIITIIAMLIGTVALIALVYYQVRHIPLLDIKVPVSTEKPTYRVGDNVNGIFFGEVYYEGEVRISRDVFCAGYQAKILTAEGDDIFTAVSKPLVLKGDVRTIGKLPNDVPVGKNCVIQFVNSYHIKTPFGVRHEERTYYTQNFLIISDRADSDQTDLESDQPDSPKLFEKNGPSSSESVKPPLTEQLIDSAEPISPPTCKIDALGVKLFCS